jgi:enoyl-CoA hydratase/carnithine racemase
MFKRRGDSDNDSKPLFTAEVKGSVAVLTFCDRAADLLGMNLTAIDQLWQIFSDQERNPSRAIVLHLPASALGPESMDRILRAHGIQADGHAHGRCMFNATDFVRQMNVMKRLIQAVRNTEAFVVVTLSGRMVLPLFGPVLACDSRIASDDFILVNRMADYCITPLGGMPWFLTRVVGKKQADDLMRRPNTIDAEAALKLGLVERVVPQNELLADAIALAQDIADRPYGNREALKQTAIAAGDSLEAYLDREEKLFNRSLAKLRVADTSGGTGVKAFSIPVDDVT